MSGEYTYVELPPMLCTHANYVKYEKWLKENIGYASLSTWYITENLGGALAERLGFHYYSSAYVFCYSEDALMFKLQCLGPESLNTIEDGNIIYRTIRLPRQVWSIAAPTR